jgi:hypothetical protein
LFGEDIELGDLEMQLDADLPHEFHEDAVAVDVHLAPVVARLQPYAHLPDQSLVVLVQHLHLLLQLVHQMNLVVAQTVGLEEFDATEDDGDVFTDLGALLDQSDGTLDEVATTGGE